MRFTTPCCAASGPAHTPPAPTSSAVNSPVRRAESPPQIYGAPSIRLPSGEWVGNHETQFATVLHATGLHVPHPHLLRQVLRRPHGQRENRQGRILPACAHKRGSIHHEQILDV